MKKIDPGQVWWDWSGHVSGGDSRATYIVLSSDKKHKNGDKVWVCANLTYYGRDSIMFLGGPNDDELLDRELLEMRFIGYLPHEIMKNSIGPYEDCMKDRAWAEKEAKINEK